MTSALDGIKVRSFSRNDSMKGYEIAADFPIAMVTKVSARVQGGAVRLKAAASFADTGDIRDIVEELWKGPGGKKQTLIDTVSI